VTAASQLSKNFNAQLREDLSVLQRKWHAAIQPGQALPRYIQPGQALPRYEEVMLGSLGRLADHMVLLKVDGDTLDVSRTGRYIQEWLGEDRWDIALCALPPRRTRSPTYRITTG
jgi:hypothetical protein